MIQLQTYLSFCKSKEENYSADAQKLQLKIRLKMVQWYEIRKYIRRLTALSLSLNLFKSKEIVILYNLKYLLFAVLAVFAFGSFVPNRPDAIRCGGDHTCCDGAVYFAHGVSTDKVTYYCQVYASEDNSGRGHYDSRRGCEGLSLSELQRLGRTFNLENSEANEKIRDLEDKVSCLQNSVNSMMNLSELKELWKMEVKQELLNDIKDNGLEIGNRWKINQESTYFVIRDYVGSTVRDSRIAFPAGTYLDPR